MSLQKNVASQKWRVFAFDPTDGTPVTGDAANISGKLSKDWAAAVATNDVNPTETEDGYYNFDMTQAETNFDNLDIFPESSTVDVEVIGVPGSQSTRVILSAANVRTEVVAALITDTYAEPTAVPAATASLKDKIGWSAALARNKGLSTDGLKTLRNDADDADIATSAHSSDGTTFTREKYT